MVHVKSNGLFIPHIQHNKKKLSFDSLNINNPILYSKDYDNLHFDISIGVPFKRKEFKREKYRRTIF